MITTILTILFALFILWLVWYAAGLFGLPAIAHQILGIALFLIFLVVVLRYFHLVDL